MHGIKGYDNWKLSYPPEYDQMHRCTSCEDHEVEFEEEELCGDCYYEKYHGAIIQMLEDAVRRLQQHFDNGRDKDIKHADTLVSLAKRQILDIGGLADVE